MPVTVPAICEVAQLELYFTALDAAFSYEFYFQYLAFILTLFIWRQVKLKPFEVYPIKATIASINLQTYFF